MKNNTPKQSTMKVIGIDKYAPLPIELLQNHDISMGAKMAYAELMSYAWFEGAAYPGQKRMMYELGIKRPETLKKYLDELKQNGLLDWEKQQVQGTNIYTLKQIPKSMKTKHKRYIKSVSEKKAPWTLGKNIGKTDSLDSGKTDKLSIGKTVNKVNEDKKDEGEGRRSFYSGVLGTPVSKNLVAKNSLTLNHEEPTDNPTDFVSRGSVFPAGGVEEAPMSKRLAKLGEAGRFFLTYEKTFDKPYPWLEDLENQNIINQLEELDNGIIDSYFSQSFREKPNYRVKHFLSDGIQRMLQLKNM